MRQFDMLELMQPAPILLVKTEKLSTVDATFKSLVCPME